MSERRDVDERATTIMIVLCAIWGLQQVSLKAAASAMAPMLQVAVRSGIAAPVLAALVLLRGETVGCCPGTWRPGMLCGLFFAMQFLFVGEALHFTSAAHTIVFLYTAPIFAALGLHVRLREERLAERQWIGIGIAFAGVIVSLIRPTRPDASDDSWVGDLLAIAGGISWGATTLTVRLSRLSDVAVPVTLLYQLVGAFVLLSVGAILLKQTNVTLTPALALNLAFQVVFVSILSFLAWFALLRRYLASRLGALSFMTPIFGVGLSVLLLRERIDLPFMLGGVLVMSGVVVVTKGSPVRKISPASQVTT